MSSAADYPYDPSLVVEFQRGLDKLRCVADRRLAQQLFELYAVCEQNETDPEFHRRERARAKRAEQVELEQLRKLADAAFQGSYGADGKSLASTMLIDTSTFGHPRRTDLVSLRVFAKELRDLRKGAA